MSTSTNTASDVGSGYLEISEKGFWISSHRPKSFSTRSRRIFFVTPDTIKRNFPARRLSGHRPHANRPIGGNSPQLKNGGILVNEMPFGRLQPKSVRFENFDDH